MAEAVYRLTTATGTMAAGLAGGSEIFQFRWANTGQCRVHSVGMLMNSLGTGFTAGVGQFDLSVARAWTAAGTGGGTATMTTDNAKFATVYGTTGVAEIRTATTAALGVGTKTLDAQPFGRTLASISTAANTVFINHNNGHYLWHVFDEGAPHLVLKGNEGFVITATVPATGTWTGHFIVEWGETV